MKILFLSDNFPPELNAPATRTYEHCREWVKAGAEVTVVTSQPNFPKGKIYEGYANKLYQMEEIDGIRVVRVWTFIAENSGFLLRILDYVSFAVMAVLASLFQKRPDVIVATSPQFFTACAGYAVSLLRWRPWIFEVRDLWPESIKAVGAMNNSLIIRMLEQLELFLYHRANLIVVVTNAFKERMVARGVSAEKIEVILNGVDLERFSRENIDPDLRTKLSLEGKFVIGYIGTHGMAHALDFILQMAKRLEKDATFSDVHFLLVGDGAEKRNLLTLYKELGVTNVTMLDPVPKPEVVKYINMIDVALVNLKRTETFKTVIPSKIFEAAALGKPILLGVDGEARKLLDEMNGGIYFEPENPQAFINALSQLMSHYSNFIQDHAIRGNISRAQKAKDFLEEVSCLYQAA